ncbi:MAG: NAD-dependent epimerase/dehydratase family protein [Planctomycetaceae bacterium]|nr:NAD-dependent epimerase/dehydratase family protein [Planctomycetaceae bacterium]
MKTALIIGGTGTISLSLTRLMAAQGGWKTTLLNRGNRSDLIPARIETLQGDIRDVDAIRSIIEPRHFDVVANFLCYTAEDAEMCVDLFRGHTEQYIHISTCAGYTKPLSRLPLTEDAPYENTAWDYAIQKREAEAVFRNAKGFPLTTVRPSHTYDDRNIPLGVRGKNAWSSITRIEQGKPVIIHGDGTSLWTITHAEDFAVGFLGLMGNREAIGQTVNLVSDESLPWEVIYRRVGEALGKPVRALFLPSDEIARSNPTFVGGLLGDKSHSLIFDTSRLRRLVPSFRTRKRFDNNTLQKILATMRADPALQIADPEFDAWCDELCAANSERIVELDNRYRKTV